MNSIFHDKRVFIVGGPGGVGKTTLAASLGVQLAQAGYRTVVLTVDPARRLAQALGFESFPKDIQRIPLPGAKGTLSASMLDTERYFDRIIETFAVSPDQKNKILGNPFYRTIVDSLGGSHEYAAMERLLEFATSSDYDKVIVDTPPSDNARELFDAPQRMADFMDNSVLKWFQGGGKLYTQFFRTGTKLALSALKLVFGAEFLDSLGRFLGDLEGMQAGFQKRNLQVLEILQGPQAAFLLVTVPSEARAQDCEAFVRTLKDKRIPLSQMLFNQLESKPTGFSKDSTPENKAIQRILQFQNALFEEQQEWAKRIEKSTGLSAVCIPRRSNAPRSIADLSELGALLVK